MSTPTPPEQPPGTPPEGSPPPAAPAPAPAAPEPSAPAAQPAEPDWKAEARKWERLAKTNKDAAEKLAQLEDSKKTETEKLSEKLTTAEKRAVEAESKALRLEVAAAKGLTQAQAKRLVGTTKEELEADADELLASFGPGDTSGGKGSGSGNKGRTPVQKLQPGALPTPPEPTLAEQIKAAEQGGKWAEARRLKAQRLLQLQENKT
ncbi:hypothetical protein QCN29_26815 [Streptomyces sp. HNM0663]|uniref:Scaffolding protein n=1 Tax=Streptomyces chengmaiensis TaxID=3040919 RepID=A0ABT6HUC7_9ACTN|nr:hypothetical protein [Streptomyces chengmaiensis]MDH2392324.1 hypothetical protein [Streptomyces chengmaiensis]